MYKETYLQLLNPEKINEIRRILINSDYPYFDSESCQKIKLCKENNFPYLFLLVDSYDQMNQTHLAMLDGLFVHIDNLAPTWHDYFYLPLIVLRQIKDENVRKITNLNNLLLHELDHLYSIVDYIDQNPEYISNAMRLNAGTCNKYNIRESMDFELGKLFNLEVKALEADFDHGERNLIFYDQGILSRVELKMKMDFVKCNISVYVVNLFAYYRKRFPDKEEFVVNVYREEVNKHGLQLFGKDAVTEIALLQIKWSRKGDALY